MHYFENVIVPNNQKSNCLFLNYLLFICLLKEKWNIIKINQERGFDFPQQYVDCDTEHRSGNLTFPKSVIGSGNAI